jgi:ribosomal protein S18 acetylase RimI-like enzyme
MKIELVICVLEDAVDEITLNDLANLTKSAQIDYAEEHAEFSFQVVTRCKELKRVINDSLLDARGSNCLVISDQLISYDAIKQKHIASKTAQALFEQIRETNSVCGLIAITRTKIAHVGGIDANVVLGENWQDNLRKRLKEITARLWYKKPPGNLFHYSGGHLFSVETTPVSDQNTLYQSLELRGSVYNSLGYIEHFDGNPMLEMDAYDLTSLHFVAMDQANGNRIAGSMRLIIPGIDEVTRGFNPEVLEKLSNYQRWCQDIAATSRDPQWWKILQRGTLNALPVMSAFEYFKVPGQFLDIDKTNMPNNICELSRVIVAPEYRGMGISRLLVNHAISVAKELRRKYLWIECAPHHIKMYEKYGFVVKDYQGNRFYERPQRLDTWVVAMYLNLADTPYQQQSESAVCYQLQIAESRGGNGSLLFQFSQQSATDIEQIFDNPITDDQLSGRTDPLKIQIPSTLSNCDIEKFITCLKGLVNRVNVQRLSLQSSTGRTFSFNPNDINSRRRETIESGLHQWLR